jgi:hypothetical protein
MGVEGQDALLLDCYGARQDSAGQECNDVL